MPADPKTSPATWSRAPGVSRRIHTAQTGADHISPSMTLLGREYSAVPTSEEAAASPAWSTRYLPKYRPQLQLTKNAVFNICLALASCCLAALAYWKLGFNVHLQFLSQSILGVPMPMRSVGYFVNWGIYGRKFFPWMIPAENLSHILYAFADIRDDGEVFLSDVWADKDIHYANDSWNEPAGNLYGNFKQLFLLKKKHRHLKVLLSIGGWTYSPKFHPVVVSPAKRTKFVQSAVKLLEDYGLDGLDVDYEYPTNYEQAKGYAELLRDLREGLDHHARVKGIFYRYALTIAAPCGPSNYEKLLVGEMDQYLDFWNLMSYDYAGSWDAVAGHQANAFGGQINTKQAVEFYMGGGVAPHKLVIGVPLYGRSFANTEGPGKPYQGVGQGSWEQGVYDYRALPLPGSFNFQDPQLMASWSYDYAKKEMISYDTEQVAQWKGEWIARVGLGGTMVWELSGDKGADRPEMEKGPGKEQQPGQPLVSVLVNAMGGPGVLDRSHNCLHYPHSSFGNLRNGMD